MGGVGSRCLEKVGGGRSKFYCRLGEVRKI